MANLHIITGVKTRESNIGYWPLIENVSYSPGDSQQEFPLYAAALHNSNERPDTTLHPFALTGDQAEELNFRLRTFRIEGNGDLNGTYDRTSVDGNPNAPTDENDLIAFPGIAYTSFPIGATAQNLIVTVGFPLDNRPQGGQPNEIYFPNDLANPVPCAGRVANNFPSLQTPLINPAACVFYDGKELPHFRMEWWTNDMNGFYSTYNGWILNHSGNTGKVVRVRGSDFTGGFWDGEAPVYWYNNNDEELTLDSDITLRWESFYSWGGTWNIRTGERIR